jgi:ribosomal protein S18 acetylase RimI-like enzyme
LAEQRRESEATTDTVAIARLEDLGRRAWPSLQVEELDGWILGTSGAYTRRANAIWPVLDGEQSLPERVDRAEAFYAARNRRAVFKLQPAARPSMLDEFLAERGYQRTSETIVKTLELDFFSESGSNGGVCVDVRETFEADWFDASVSLGMVVGVRRDDYRAIIDRLGTSAIARLFGRAESDGRITSLALGCVVDGVVSLVEVATAQEDRGQRLADDVLRAIIQKARANGATQALLSVEAHNSAARRLYERLGFVERYRYWYREAPEA